MKVIAKVDNTRVICEVSREEIAMLNGFRGPYDDGCKIDHLMAVNSECNLKKMVATSQFIRSLRKDVLVNVKNELKDIVDHLSEVEEEVSKLEIFETLKEEEKF